MSFVDASTNAGVVVIVISRNHTRFSSCISASYGVCERYSLSSGLSLSLSAVVGQEQMSYTSSTATKSPARWSLHSLSALLATPENEARHARHPSTAYLDFPPRRRSARASAASRQERRRAHRRVVRDQHARDHRDSHAHVAVRVPVRCTCTTMSCCAPSSTRRIACPSSDFPSTLTPVPASMSSRTRTTMTYRLRP